MNILIIANKLPYPAKDGGSIATLNLALGLQQAGHSISLLAMNTSKHYFDINLIPEQLQQKIKFYDCFVNTNIRICKLIQNLLFSRKPYNAARFIHKDFKNKLKELLLKNTYDIVQMEGLYVLPYISVIQEHTNAFVSYRAHNVEFEIWERIWANELNALKRIYISNLIKRLKQFERSYINTYDVLLPITKRDLEKLNELGNTKNALVAPTGVDMKNYMVEEENNFPSLFFIGALDWIPNQEGLIWFLENCWKEIKRKRNNLQLKIAGRNAQDDFVRKIEKYDIQYIGEVDDAISFMNENAIMIVPLLSGSGMRIKIIEGMALGKVVVSTSIGAEGIDVEHNRNILIANLQQDIVDIIIEITNDIDRFSEISLNARTFISKHYDNFAIAEKVSDFYIHNIKQ